MRPIVLFTWMVAYACLAVPPITAQPGGANAAIPRANHGMDAARLKAIRTRLDSFVEQGTLAGAVVLIGRRGETAFNEAVGFRNLDAREPMQTTTIFGVASLTKNVTALGIMILQEKGRLALTDPVQKHLPEFKDVRSKDGSRPASPVTIHGLLTHSGGIAAERVLFKPEYLSKSLAEVVRAYASAPLEHEPGTAVNYSSPGYDILGRIIEVASGKPYEAFITEQVLRPLRMEDSHFFLPPAKRNRLASSYRKQAGKLVSAAVDPQHDARVFPAPGWGLYSTASDIGRLLQMMLSEGNHGGRQFVSRASVRMMTTDQIAHLRPLNEPMSNGFAWGVPRRAGIVGPLASAKAYRTIASSGSIVWVDPDQELIGVVLTQQPVDLMMYFAVMSLATETISK